MSDAVSDPETHAAFSQHDHTHCVASTLMQAERVAAERGLRLTPVRRRVLEILLERHSAMGAYDVLERLAEEGFGHQPPVAYRALDFLVTNGLAHRIRRINAFIACDHPGEAHNAAFLVCDTCNSVAEIPADDLRAMLEAGARSTGFAIERATIEAAGQCPECRARANDGAGNRSDNETPA